MTQQRFMQYNFEQDNRVEECPICKMMGINIASLCGEIASKEVNYNLKEEIALYNALLEMERKTPSVNNIRDAAESYFRTFGSLDNISSVIGRDFESNQPIFYGHRILRNLGLRPLGEPIMEEINPIAFFVALGAI